MNEHEFPTIVWKTPPLRGQTQRYVWEDHLRPLMEKPGRWALVDVRSGSAASNAVKRLREQSWRIPEGRWQFLAVRTDDNRGEIYARYLGSDNGERPRTHAVDPA